MMLHRSSGFSLCSDACAPSHSTLRSTSSPACVRGGRRGDGSCVVFRLEQTRRNSDSLSPHCALRPRTRDRSSSARAAQTGTREPIALPCVA